MIWDEENSKLNENQQNVMRKTSELWNDTIKLNLDSDDTNDLRFHIHSIQRLIMALAEQK